MSVALAAAAGGALGAMLRVWLADILQEHPPMATLLVNVIGSFIAGIAVATLSGAPLVFVTVGLCGALTTFSTFANEVTTYARGSDLYLAVGYAIGTALACLLAAWFGLWLL